MTSNRQPSARTGRRLAATCVLAVAVSLAGCWGDDDDNSPTPTPTPTPTPAGQGLTAAQITAAQEALDTQSSPIDVSSTGSGDIATSQTALDDQTGVTKEAGK